MDAFSKYIKISFNFLVRNRLRHRFDTSWLNNKVSWSYQLLPKSQNTFANFSDISLQSLCITCAICSGTHSRQCFTTNAGVHIFGEESTPSSPIFLLLFGVAHRFCNACLTYSNNHRWSSVWFSIYRGFQNLLLVCSGRIAPVVWGRCDDLYANNNALKPGHKLGKPYLYPVQPCFHG